LRARKRQRLDEHRIDDAEDRGGRADSEREREYRGERERGAARQRAQRTAHVAADGIDETDDVHAAPLAGIGLQCSNRARHAAAWDPLISVVPGAPHARYATRHVPYPHTASRVRDTPTGLLLPPNVLLVSDRSTGSHARFATAACRV